MYSNPNCLCQQKNSCYKFQNCCCEVYRNKNFVRSPEEKNLWQLTIENTDIKTKSTEIYTDFRCSCSKVNYCACCQESKSQYCLDQLEISFMNLLLEKNISYLILISLIKGIQYKTNIIKDLEKKIYKEKNQCEMITLNFQKELGSKEQQIKDLKEKLVIAENKIKSLNAETAKLEKSLYDERQKIYGIEKKSIVKDDEINNLLNKDNVESDKRVYDFIIHIDSLNDLKNDGWKLSYNENDVHNKEKIQESLNSSKILVGVIGYENVGKTHFLNKLCGDNLPYGYNYHTQGLSFKISENEKLPFIYADAAGCGKPFSYYPKSLVPVSDKDKNLEDKCDIVNDRIMTETFIQDFILANCNIIMIILGQLTQENQKMIERIIRNYYNKKIFIIHNFSNLAYVQSVEEKVKRDIIEAFPVKEQNLLAFDDKTYDINRNYKQFIEERKGNCISHLIYAREETEAGQYYN